jgi:(p)ppGpp synthase/HD superfamily hydrolase
MTLTPQFETALLDATRLHATQVRKGTTIPYVAHLLGVCSIVLEYGGDEAQAIAALLHDAVEDQGGASVLAYIRATYGAEVARLVEGCTDADVIPKPPWRARKEAYIAHLPHTDERLRLVSAADKLYNARAILRDYRTLGEGLWARFNGGRDGTLWYYRALAAAFVALGPFELAAELNRVVTELEALAKAQTSGV